MTRRDVGIDRCPANVRQVWNGLSTLTNLRPLGQKDPPLKAHIGRRLTSPERQVAQM
jgi:hypothetical protein